MYYVELMLNGLLIGSLYSIVALGFVLIYKASQVINFAQGEFVMFAGYVIAFWILSLEFHIAVAAVLALVVMVFVGLLVEWAVLRHLIGRPVVAVIMATIGLASFLQGTAQLLFGVETRSVPLPIDDYPVFIGDLLLNRIELVAAVFAGLGFAAVGWFFIKSRYGIALRAIADDQQVSLAMGIDVKTFFGIAWAIAGVVALVGGVFWGNASGGRHPARPHRPQGVSGGDPRGARQHHRRDRRGAHHRARREPRGRLPRSAGRRRHEGPHALRPHDPRPHVQALRAVRPEDHRARVGAGAGENEP